MGQSCSIQSVQKPHGKCLCITGHIEVKAEPGALLQIVDKECLGFRRGSQMPESSRWRPLALHVNDQNSLAEVCATGEDWDQIVRYRRIPYLRISHSGVVCGLSASQPLADKTRRSPSGPRQSLSVCL